MPEVRSVHETRTGLLTEVRHFLSEISASWVVPIGSESLEGNQSRRDRVRLPSPFFQLFLLLFFLLINLFMAALGLHRWVFVAACRLCLVAVNRGYSLLRCAGFSLRWLLLLWSTGSRCAGFSSCGTWALECRLSRCGAQA